MNSYTILHMRNMLCVRLMTCMGPILDESITSLAEKILVDEPEVSLEMSIRRSIDTFCVGAHTMLSLPGSVSAPSSLENDDVEGSVCKFKAILEDVALSCPSAPRVWASIIRIHTVLVSGEEAWRAECATAYREEPLHIAHAVKMVLDNLTAYTTMYKFASTYGAIALMTRSLLSGLDASELILPTSRVIDAVAKLLTSIEQRDAGSMSYTAPATAPTPATVPSTAPATTPTTAPVTTAASTSEAAANDASTPSIRRDLENATMPSSRLPRETRRRKTLHLHKSKTSSSSLKGIQEARRVYDDGDEEGNDDDDPLQRRPLPPTPPQYLPPPTPSPLTRNALDTHQEKFPVRDRKKITQRQRPKLAPSIIPVEDDLSETSSDLSQSSGEGTQFTVYPAEYDE